MKFSELYTFVFLLSIANTVLCSDLTTATNIMKAITSAHNGAFGMDNLITKPLPREKDKMSGNEPVMQWNKVVDAAVNYIKSNAPGLRTSAEQLGLINQRMIQAIDAAHQAYVAKKSKAQIKQIISPLRGKSNKEFLDSLGSVIKSDVSISNSELAKLNQNLKAQFTKLYSLQADLAKARKSLTTRKIVGDRLEADIALVKNTIDMLNKSIDTVSMPVLLERLRATLEVIIDALFASLERAFPVMTPARISAAELQEQITAAKAKLKPINPK